MKQATLNLENDHIQILRLIDVMEVITRTATPDVIHMETIVSLIRNFADGIHHEKEELLLFPLMAQRGFSLEQGPVAVMLHDHAQGRLYVKGISEGIDKYKAGDQTAVKSIFENMQGYIDLLRSHISKENNILFRMADNSFSDSDNASLLTSFAEVEQNNRFGIDPSGFIGSIEFLAKIYLT